MVTIVLQACIVKKILLQTRIVTIVVLQARVVTIVVLQARMLVTELNLLQVILDTFLEHCKPKLNSKDLKLSLVGHPSHVTSHTMVHVVVLDPVYEESILLTAVIHPRPVFSHCVTVGWVMSH